MKKSGNNVGFRITYQRLGAIEKRLIEEAERAMEKAYNPLSKFYVGAAILSHEGQIITGTNVENAAYGPTICAERSAIVKANSVGIRNFDKIAIIARGKDFDTKEVTGPCGTCRQVIYEFSSIYNKDIEVIMSTTKKDKIVIATIRELLPFGFGTADLGIDVSEYRV